VRWLLLAFFISAHCQAQDMDGSSGIVFILWTGKKERDLVSLEKNLKDAGYRPKLLPTLCDGDLQCWARLKEGDFTDYVARAAKRVHDQKPAAVIGISRYGYLALLLAAKDEGQTSYAVISPVVNLLDLEEFRGQKKTSISDIRDLADSLQGKRIFIAIGRYDTRVNTFSSITLTRKVPSITLLMTASNGRNYPPVNRIVVDWIKRESYWN